MYEAESGRFCGRDPVPYNEGASSYQIYISMMLVDSTGMDGVWEPLDPRFGGPHPRVLLPGSPGIAPPFRGAPKEHVPVPQDPKYIPKTRTKVQEGCCRKIVKAGKVNNKTEGWVVCCNGELTACGRLWTPLITYKPADQIILECILIHEEDHFDIVIPCDKLPGKKDRQCEKMYFPPSMQGNKKQQATEECPAYKKQIACMVSRKNECNGDPTCEGFVEYKIEQVTRTMKQECATAGMQ